MTKVFDCFTFFNEIEILELRFQQMFDAVDFFVIAESEQTFTGLKKPLTFLEHASRFKPYMDKVIHVVVNDVPDSNNPFDREHFQRNALVRGLGRSEPSDFIMISDVDELLRPEAIGEAKHKNGYVCFDMPMYQFYMNLQERPRGWLASYGFQWKYLDKIFDLSLARWDRTRVMAEFPTPDMFHVVHNAGWHFTHLGGVERLQQKFSSYSHSPDRWPRAMMQEGALKKHITAGGVVGNFKEVAKFVPLDSTFPKMVIEREAHFREIGFIRNVYEALADLQAEHRALKDYLALELYDDPRPRSVLYGLSPKDYADMAGHRPPLPTRLAAIKPRAGSLLSRGKRATQSSLSPWSVGDTIGNDASGALDGQKTGGFRFHTAFEWDPWWMVDLEDNFTITEVHIYNRLQSAEAQVRASRIKIEVGMTPDSLIEVYRKEDGTPFGGADGNPLIWAADRPLISRFVRISLIGEQSLHFDQVEVFGFPTAPDATGGQPHFTSDWFSAYDASWKNIFRGAGWNAAEPKTVVELGCFEGRASLWILNNLLQHPRSRLHCVDLFPDEDDNPNGYSARHRRNMLTSDRANMAIRHSRYSYDFLIDFVQKGEKADFIYIDASHRSPEVLEDLMLSFQALKVGGVIICDDYLGGSPIRGSEGVLSTPKMAIDVFTTLFNDRLTIIRGQPLYQLAFVKTAGRGRDDPSSRGDSRATPGVNCPARIP